MLIKWMLFLCAFLLIANLVMPLQATEENPIKAIVFDFGSVIAKTNKDEVAQFISQSLKISQIEALDSLKLLKEEGDDDKKEEDYWIHYTNSKKIKLPSQWQEKLDAIKLEATREMPGMVDLVKDLQKQGYKTALLSNILQKQAGIKWKTGLYDLFHPLLLSYAIEAKKPDPKAYEILLNALKLPPKAVLFIDNKKENIDAAKALGIDGIVFVDRDQLVQELKKRGIEISTPKN